jgi:cupin 2 domain-containing protein
MLDGALCWLASMPPSRKIETRAPAPGPGNPGRGNPGRGNPGRGNLFRGVEASHIGASTRGEEEWVDVLARVGGTRIERIVSRGHRSPEGFWYDQREWEWVVVVSGRARLELEGQGEIALAAGDWLEIPARARHRVTWTDPSCPTVWLAVFRTPEPAPRDDAPGGS